MDLGNLPAEYLELIKLETDVAIKRGWDAAKSAWRAMALTILCEICLTKKEFTVNDFRDRIRKSDIKTHDNRAMGGLMTTAKRYGWITSVDEIPSKVGHRTKIQVWRSLIFQEPSRRELRELHEQPLPLFAKQQMT